MRHSARALRSDGKTFFCSSPIFGRKILRKSLSTRGNAQCKSCLGITRFVGVTILMYHFSITIHLYLASFYAQNTFKKIS